MTTTTPLNEVPTVLLVQTFGSETVHAGKLSRTLGRSVLGCSGRTVQALAGTGPADLVTCKTCRKAVTA